MLRDKLIDPVARFIHWRWITTEAAVIECTPIYKSYYLSYSTGPLQPIFGYKITYAYNVQNKTYQGKTKTMDQYHEKDKITIVYHPGKPEKNYGFQGIGAAPKGTDGWMLLFMLAYIFIVLCVVKWFF